MYNKLEQDGKCDLWQQNEIKWVAMVTGDPGKSTEQMTIFYTCIRQQQ
jgi:hypothetical protein